MNPLSSDKNCHVGSPRRSSGRRWGSLATLMCWSAVVIFALCVTWSSAHAAPPTAGPASASATPVSSAPTLQPVDGAQPPSQVLVGAYLYFVRGLDTRANTFVADFYVWFLWSGDRDPTKSFEFMNALGAPTKVAVFTDPAGVDTPEVLPDGRKYQQYHVQGTFGSAMDFSTYPLDRHVLSIELEDTKTTIRDLLYAVDEPSTTVHSALSIPGWVRRGFSGRASHVEYATTFGDPREQGSVKYAHLSFGLQIERPRPWALIEGLAPVIVTMLVGLGALFLHSGEFGTRLAMYATGVMTVVFINMDLATKVPEGSGTLLRQITATCFVLLVLVAFAGIRSLHLIQKGEADAARRFDRICFAATTAGLALACGFILWGKY